MPLVHTLLLMPSGMNLCCSTACNTGSHAIADAFRYELELFYSLCDWCSCYCWCIQVWTCVVLQHVPLVPLLLLMPLGMNLCCSTACATGAHAIDYAFRCELVLFYSICLWCLCYCWCLHFRYELVLFYSMCHWCLCYCWCLQVWTCVVLQHVPLVPMLLLMPSGMNLCCSTACASGAFAIDDAFRYEL